MKPWDSSDEGPIASAAEKRLDATQTPSRLILQAAWTGCFKPSDEAATESLIICFQSVEADSVHAYLRSAPPRQAANLSSSLLKAAPISGRSRVRRRTLVRGQTEPVMPALNRSGRPQICQHRRASPAAAAQTSRRRFIVVHRCVIGALRFSTRPSGQAEVLGNNNQCGGDERARRRYVCAQAKEQRGVTAIAKTMPMTSSQLGSFRGPWLIDFPPM
jgi:hypothetical protein